MIAKRAEQRQRHAGIVDQRGVGLVDQCEGMTALDGFRGGKFHVVAQIVEAELAGDPVGDIATIGLTPAVVVHLLGDDAGAQSQQIVNRAHPAGVALGQIVVRRGDVDAFAGQGMQRADQRGGQRFAFAGLHLGDKAIVKRESADDLRRNGMLVQRTARGFAGQCEDFFLDLVEGRAGSNPPPQFGDAIAQRAVRQPPVVCFQTENPAGRRFVPCQFPASAEIQRAPSQAQDHRNSKRIGIVKANCVPPTSFGGSGNGWARCRRSSVSRSRASDPLPLTILLEMTWPWRSTTKDTRDVPVS